MLQERGRDIKKGGKAYLGLPMFYDIILPLILISFPAASGIAPVSVLFLGEFHELRDAPGLVLDDWGR